MTLTCSPPKKNAVHYNEYMGKTVHCDSACEHRTSGEYADQENHINLDSFGTYLKRKRIITQ